MANRMFDQLNKELKERSKKPDMPIFIAVPIVVSMIIVILITNSSFVFFYKNYLILSLFSALILLTILFVLARKYNKLSFVGISLILILFSTHLVPLAFHYMFGEKENVCFEATIGGRYFSYTSGNIGWINIRDIDSDSKNIRAISRMPGIPKYEYDQLPPAGSKIQICGQLSKVGFSYEYIDTVP